MTLSRKILLLAALASATALATADDMITDAISSPHRSEANRERDGDRHPDQVLGFIGLAPGAVVLDWGSGGGYWAELFAGIVGDDGRVYAQQRAGERFDERRAALVAQYAPFGNVELLATESGRPIPLADASVDVVMLSYIFHHMHYADGSGEAFPEASQAVLGEFLRVLKPGGALIVIEHAAADGSGRAQSAAWHRTPPDMANADITAAGFNFGGEAPDIFLNPDDDRQNNWNEAGLRGHTTSFVHRYVRP